MEKKKDVTLKQRLFDGQNADKNAAAQQQSQDTDNGHAAQRNNQPAQRNNQPAQRNNQSAQLADTGDDSKGIFSGAKRWKGLME